MDPHWQQDKTVAYTLAIMMNGLIASALVIFAAGSFAPLVGGSHQNGLIIGAFICLAVIAIGLLQQHQNRRLALMRWQFARAAMRRSSQSFEQFERRTVVDFLPDQEQRCRCARALFGSVLIEKNPYSLPQDWGGWVDQLAISGDRLDDRDFYRFLDYHQFQ